MNTKTEITNSPKYSTFFNNLITLCNRYNVNIYDAVRRAGICNDYIERWKNGDEVTYGMLGLLSIYFHIPVDYFFRLSVNADKLGDSIERTLKKPFEFLYEILLVICRDNEAKVKYKQVVAVSEISLPAFFDEKGLKYALESNHSLTPSQMQSAYYVLSKIKKNCIRTDLAEECEKEIQLLNKMGCKDVINWSNPLKNFHFEHNHIKSILRYVIKSADVRNQWIKYIRFNEHYIYEIKNSNIVSFINDSCPDVVSYMRHLNFYCHYEDGRDLGKMIYEIFGDEATAVGVCDKYHISVS